MNGEILSADEGSADEWDSLETGERLDRHRKESQNSKGGDLGFIQGLRRNWRPTLTAVILVISSSLSNNLALSIIHDRVPRNQAPLPDLWFSVFPEIPAAIRVAEIGLSAIVAQAGLLLFIFPTNLAARRNRWRLIRRIMVIFAIGYFYRAVAICLVQVPVPSRRTYCAPQLLSMSSSSQNGTTRTTIEYISTVWHRVFRIFSNAGMELREPRVLCGDLIVSGHTISLISFMKSIHRYYRPTSPRYRSAVVWTSTITVTGSLVCVLLARKHYLIDVVLGYCISTFIWNVYHGLVDQKKLLLEAGGNDRLLLTEQQPQTEPERRRSTAIRQLQQQQPSLCHFWWYFLFEWFENDDNSSGADIAVIR